MSLHRGGATFLLIDNITYKCVIFKELWFDLLLLRLTSWGK